MLLSDHVLDYDEKKWEEMENLWDLVRELEGEENRGMFSEPKEEVLNIISKIKSNFFGVWSMNGNTAVWSGASVYIRCSFFNHTCFPNCLVAQETKPSQQLLDRNSIGAIFTVRSVCDIEEGEELSLSYIPLDVTTEKRRNHLNTNWMFTCSCERCMDPESDTKPIDAFCCPIKGCSGGLLVPEGRQEREERRKREEEMGEEREGDGKEEEIEGWCRLCNSSAVLPNNRNMFRKL